MNVRISIPIFLILCLCFQIDAIAQQSNELLDREFWRSKPSVADVKKKVQEGHSPTAFTSSMFDPTTYAILEDNDLSVVKYLLSQGNDVNKITHDKRTYLHWAAYRGQTEIMEYLITAGIKTELVDDGGNSAMLFAARAGQSNKQVYELLTQNGIDIKQRNERNGRNILLTFAGRMQDTKMLDYFIGLGVDINEKDNNGNGIFHYAAVTRNKELLEKLVADYKVDFKVNAKTGENAFYFATNRNFDEKETSAIALFEYFESLGLDPAKTTASGRNALHNLAYRSNDIALLEYFIDKGADVNQVDSDGNTPLINASARGSIKKIKFIADATDDLDRKNNDGFSSFMRAIKYNSMDVVEFLSEASAKVELSAKGAYDLGYHVVDGTRQDFELLDQKMKFLISKGYDPKTPQFDGQSLLHVAIARQNVDFLKRLIALGIDINAKDGNGQTILHHAAMQAETNDLLKFLIASGADKNIRTEFEESAYDLALENEILSTDSSKIEFLKTQQ
ncbi:ankyrin repeat domain-containing protein [Roseivirga sp.]|uniref:ankyrin repeat domain-containing protein n=1 Tax=Roseivirga sp. TaxID=1964215 RepID=UPI003B8B04A5